MTKDAMRLAGSGPARDHGPNVIRIADRRRPILSPALATVEAHWLDLAAGRIMPARAQLDPRRLGPVLDRVFLLERRTGQVARLRVAGHGVARFGDAGSRHRPLAALFDPDQRPALAPALDAVFDEPARILLGVAAGPVPGQMLILPLRDDRGACSRAIGALELAGAPDAAAGCLRITRRHHRTLLGYGRLPGTEGTAARRAALTLVSGSGRAG